MNGSVRTLMIMGNPGRILTNAKNLLLWLRLALDSEARATWNEFFNAGQYRRLHGDVAKAKVSPLIHFLLYGNKELRDPSQRFHVAYYLQRYPEVASANVNALLHFALFGHREGRAITKEEPESRFGHLSINNVWRKDLPLVSVVIPCFNYGEFVDEAIQSVLRQTFTDFEIIVVEGGSTDLTTVAEIQRLEALGLPKTRFVYRSERHLVGDNRNFGISQAQGRYVCCLDADDRLRPVYLETAVFLAESFGFDIVTPSVQSFGESDLIWLLHEPSFPFILSQNYVATAALFRRSAWAHVGGFRDWGIRDAHVPEDWDFWIRLLGHGFVSESIREPLMMYRVHRGSLSIDSAPALDEQRRILGEANKSLTESAVSGHAITRRVLNPWENLAAPRDNRTGFLLALPFVTIGGAEKVFRLIAQRIAETGERLLVITSLTLPDSVPDDIASFEGISPHVYSLSTLFSTDGVRQQFLRYLIKHYSIKTVMLAGCELMYHALPALREEFPNLSVIDQLFNDSVHVPNNRHYSEAIDATVVPSKQLAEFLMNHHGADPSSIHVIPHGIPTPQEQADQAGSFPAMPQDKVIIGYFGRLSEEKAPDLFVEIVQQLRTRSDLHFVMTGQGPERDNVLALIRKYDLGERIQVPGFVNDVLPLMRATDVIVLPSRIDGMPLVVLEAQSLGKPVVASKVGSIPEMIEHETTGFLCEAGNVAAFCDYITLLAGNLSLRQRMGAIARKNVLEKYGAQAMLNAYQRVFEGTRTRQDKAFVHRHS